jgi:hypothetical protein
MARRGCDSRNGEWFLDSEVAKMKRRKDNYEKQTIDPAKPRHKLELRRATLRKLTTEQLSMPAGGAGSLVIQCMISLYTWCNCGY